METATLNTTDATHVAVASEETANVADEAAGDADVTVARPNKKRQKRRKAKHSRRHNDDDDDAGDSGDDCESDAEFKW